MVEEHWLMVSETLCISSIDKAGACQMAVIGTEDGRIMDGD